MTEVHSPWLFAAAVLVLNATPGAVLHALAALFAGLAVRLARAWR
jgi:hypothetical protein